MADVMLSYASVDRPTAQMLSDRLEADGFDVWFDREIPPGQDFNTVIENELREARAVVVLWSQASVGSRWVAAEAGEAASAAKLVPASLDDAIIPLEFRRIQAADLTGWRGEPSHPGYQALVKVLRAGSSPAAVEPSPPPRSAPAPTPRDDWQHRAMWFVGAAVVAALIVVAILVLPPDVSDETTATTSGTTTSASTSSNGPTDPSNGPGPPKTETFDLQPVFEQDLVQSVECTRLEGCNHVVHFTVENLGNAESPASVAEIRVSDNPPVTASVPPVPPGDSVRMTVDVRGDNCWNPDCYVVVTLDPTNSIDETNERNNEVDWFNLG